MNGYFSEYWLEIHLISRGCQTLETSEREMGTYWVQGRKFAQHLLKWSSKWLRGTDYQETTTEDRKKYMRVWEKKCILKSVLIWFCLCMTQLYCWVLTDFRLRIKQNEWVQRGYLHLPYSHNESLQRFGKNIVGLYSTSFPICAANPRVLAIITVLACISQIKKDLFLQWCKLFWQGLFGQYLCSPKTLWEYK